MSSINNESTENKVENKEGKLKRELGLFQVVMFIFGYVVGAGILVQAGSAAAYTGPSLWIAFIVAGIPNLLGTLILIKLIEDIPVSGGFWVYSSRLGGPLVGFFAMISIVFHLVGSLALMAVGFGEYFEFYIPDSALIVGICILLIFFIINVLGIKIAIRVQVVLAIVGDFLVIFLFIIFGLPLVNSGNLLGVGGDGLFPNGIGGTFMGAVILSFSYAGFSAVAEIGGEVKNPKRTIPLGIIIAFILVTTVYILISIVMIGVMDWQELGEGGTFIDVGQNIFPAFILNFLNILILIAIASTIHGILLAFSRDLFAAARDKMIPEIFSKINKKYNTPHFSIAFFSIGAICLTFFMQNIVALSVLVNFTSTIGMLVFAYVPLRIEKFNELSERMDIKINKKFLMFLVIMNIGYAGLSIIAMIAMDFTVILSSLVFYGIAIAYYIYRRKWLKKQGIDIEAICNTIPEEAFDE